MRIPEDFAGREHILFSIEVLDNEEPLVDIADACPEILIKSIPIPGIAHPKAFVRITVAELLNRAQALLPLPIVLVTRDAWRSSATQQYRFDTQKGQYRTLYTEWTEEQLDAAAARFVARPGPGELPPPHTTGGAVDIRLAWRKNERLLPMRRSFRYLKKKLGPRGAQEQWDAQKYLAYTNLPRHILRNRELLNRVMTSVGFAACPYEYWHFSYGDVYWAGRSGSKTAFYGPVAL